MRNRKIISFITVLLSTIIIQTGCSHQELYYVHTGEITINFHWSASRVNTSKSTRDIEEITVYLFPEDGSSPLRFVLTGYRGGIIEDVPLGHYKVIAYNSDTEVLLPIGGMTYESFGLRANTTSLLSPMGIKSDDGVPRIRGMEDEPITWGVDPVWAGRVKSISLTAGETDIRVNVDMEECFSSISITVNNIGNLQNATAYSATVDGMAYSYFPGTDEVSPRSTIIPFAITAGDDNSITGNFLTFGHSADEGHTHNLVLYFILLDGTKVYYSFDITEAMHEATAMSTGEISLEFDEFCLPDVMNDPEGKGLAMDILPWEHKEIPIHL